MKTLLSRMSVAFLVLVAWALPVADVTAQSELQPGIVISMVNIDEHLSDMEYLMDAAGFGQMAPLVRMGAQEYIRGIETKKPIGAMLFFEEETPEPKVLAFIPVSDIDDVLDTIAPFVDIDEDGDTILLTADDGTEFTVKESDGFAFVSDDPELLDSIPGDPVSLLDNMQDTYNLSAKLYGQRIPESLRNQGLEWIKQGAAREMENLDDSPQAALQRQNFEYSMKQMEQLINETAEVVAGLAIDQDNKRVFIDVSMEGLPDSKFARQSQTIGDAPNSRFTGFLVDDAAMNFHMNAKMLDEDIPEMEKMLDSLKTEFVRELESEIPDEDQRQVVQSIVEDLMDVMGETFKGGVLDGGGVINLDEDKANFAVGMSVGEPAKLESSLRSIAEIAEAESDVPVEFNFNASSDNGVTYHEIDIEIPDSEEEARQVFGDSVKVIVGIGDDVVYLAGGENAKETLEQCMSGSNSGDHPPMQYNIRVAPMLRFFGKMEDQEELFKMAESLTEAGNDRVRIFAKGIDNGQMIRIEIEDGILKLIGDAAQQFGGGFGPRQDF